MDICYFPQYLHNLHRMNAGCRDNVVQCAGAPFEQLIDLPDRVFGIQSLPYAMGVSLNLFDCCKFQQGLYPVQLLLRLPEAPTLLYLDGQACLTEHDPG